jgi:fumarate reductase (CoM/CoB) subunit B
VNRPLPLIDDAVREAAVHGSFCPKLCNHVCPVTAATGRAEAMPWAFHRTVADLATGRVDPGAAAAAGALTYCTGCLACREPCAFDQDVPEQVRAGRAAVLPEDGVLAAAADAVAAIPPPELGDAPSDPESTTALVAGCGEADVDAVVAAARLLEASGRPARLVALPGCCGSALRDLGAVIRADAALARTGEALAGCDTVVAVDPHCLPSLRDAAGEEVAVRHAVAEVARRTSAGELTFGGSVGPVTYHDPCLLARGEGVVQEPRTLLAAVGATVAEPEWHGLATACSGAGLGLPLLDADAAEAVAARRRDDLAATAAPTLVTACGGARRRLSTDGTAVADLLTLLADHLIEAAP